MGYSRYGRDTESTVADDPTNHGFGQLSQLCALKITRYSLLSGFNLYLRNSKDVARDLIQLHLGGTIPGRESFPAMLPSLLRLAKVVSPGHSQVPGLAEMPDNIVLSTTSRD
jgi:hypothetical protein